MIPVKLELKNFMPYRDNVPTLHFNEIHRQYLGGEWKWKIVSHGCHHLGNLGKNPSGK